ncbi:AfsR/SARP family transcriptional regulator [Actinocrispum wychmicini]|uniref:DNA-binding SARP family transcriptional activator n=1 Tax=Actinocrispum wychmicini TaxID=1213861 RepID=A0A4R2JPV5_9PSEU|nr:AfsR/SARP family transcriptional regulator [Actinocrispum wychmicini]TCO60812.1 DNA-binding SARP family transcriptional activator [Actinocrispum wychmicini]
MRYDVLGTLRVVDGPTQSFISARKVETVLAVLLIRADHVVTMDQLMAEIWSERPPARAAAGLHVYISQLRKFLHGPDRDVHRVVTHSPGYLLRLGGDQLDCDIFLDLVSQGRSCVREGRPEDACDRFEQALGLWRGPVLGDLRSGPIINGFVTWLAEARIECLETLIDLRLDQGEHRELVGRLYALTAENPLHEAFYRQLMLALYRSNRQADALGVYRMARATLNDELGVEPCRDLRELQRAILFGDQQLDLAARR